MAGARDEPLPTWSLALAGALLAAWLSPWDAPAAGAPPRPAPLALGEASARELREVPGLGETRALALVDARWRRSSGDPPLLLGDVPGVGPVSLQKVGAWLRERAPERGEDPR